MYYAQIEIPTGAVISGLEYIEASPHVEGNVMAALYDGAGRRIAQRSQGSATPGANSAHRVPFDRPCHAPAGVYNAALVFDGPSRFHGAYTLVPAGATKLESFTCPPSLRVPTEIAAGSLKVPLMSTF